MGRAQECKSGEKHSSEGNVHSKLRKLEAPKKAFQGGPCRDWHFEGFEEERLRGMISKSGKPPIWRFLCPSGQQTTRAIKAVLWVWNGEGECHRFGLDLHHLVFGG